MKMKTIRLACIAISAMALGQARAATVDFTGIDLSDVASVTGQNFTYTVGAGPAVGIVNVRLVSGDASAVTTGASPDTTGFFAQQAAPNLAPATYEFTLSTPAAFIINQNESLTTYETNGFTLMPTGTWTVLSSSNVTTTVNGSNISFLGAGGANEQPPYGNYSIEGTGTAFDFKITDAAGLQNYGNAISLNIVGVPEPGSLCLLAAGAGATLCFCRRRD